MNIYRPYSDKPLKSTGFISNAILLDEDFENAQWCGNVKLQTIENVCAGLHISGSIVIG